MNSFNLIKIIDNNNQTIFYNGGLTHIYLDNLSVDFIKGFLFAYKLKYRDNKPNIEIITDIKININDVLIEDYMTITINMEYLHTKPPDKEIISKFKSIINNLEHVPIKRYYAIIDNNWPTLIHFDTIDFLSGIETYSSWTSSLTDEIRLIALFDNAEYRRLSVEYNFQSDREEKEIKYQLSELTLNDIANIIWDYFIFECSYYRRDQMKCITKHWETKLYGIESCFGCFPSKDRGIFTAKVSVT